MASTSELSKKRDRPVHQIMESNPLFTRREMLGAAGMTGLTALAGMTPLAGSAAGAVPSNMQTRPRIACIVTFWGAPGSHADWIITKLMDGYWWQGAHTPSRVDAGPEVRPGVHTGPIADRIYTGHCRFVGYVDCSGAGGPANEVSAQRVRAHLGCRSSRALFRDQDRASMQRNPEEIPL